jgi:hypothetical protein
MSKLFKTIAIALTAGTMAFGATAIATPTPAEAKKKGVVIVVGHGHGHGHHHFHRHRGVYLTSSYVTPGCGWLYSKWQNTGAFYWKKRYYECRGWW